MCCVLRVCTGSEWQKGRRDVDAQVLRDDALIGIDEISSAGCATSVRFIFGVC